MKDYWPYAIVSIICSICCCNLEDINSEFVKKDPNYYNYI